MFSGCSSLASLDLSSFNTEYVRNMKYTFNYCPQLERILVGDGWKTDRVAEGEYMFYGCSKLTGGKGTQHDEEKVGVAYARIDGGKGAHRQHKPAGTARRRLCCGRTEGGGQVMADFT